MNLPLRLLSALAYTLLHSLWQLALIGLIAALGLAALRGATARARHTLGMVGLLAMLLAPIATFTGYLQPLPAGAASAWVGIDTDPAALSAGELALPAPAWQAWLVLGLAQLWLVGVIAMALRQLVGWRWMQRVETQPYAPLPAEWQARCDALQAALGIGRAVSVRLARHIASPFTAHLLRPLIWLPLGLLSGLPAAQVEALLAHELAHIARLDACWNALQCAAETLLFHHPAMWWLSRRVRDEREHACDDLAVAACGDAIALAEALAALQRRGRTPSTPRPGLAAQGGHLMKRISHLLSGAPARPNWRLPGALLLLLGSSSLLATQLVPPTQILTNLRFEASSQGELTPGNYREYNASYLGGKPRRYRISMDAQGRVEEVYAEAGQRRTIDGGVRQWLAAMQAMNDTPTQAEAPPAAPAPPSPTSRPSPPSPPSPSSRPAPPEPPEPPAHLEPLSAETEALMASIAADHRVLAVTGQPVHFERSSFHGSIHTWGARDFHLWGIDDPVGGKARFRMTFVGPQGRVEVAYAGRTGPGGVWQAETLDLVPTGP